MFKIGNFILHSGQNSDFLIDCESLTDEDLRALAHKGRQLVRSFGTVLGIPQGGLRFAEALKMYATKDSPYRLIVDDVMTTGKSMKKYREDQILDRGLVIFNRGRELHWVTAIFNLG